MPTPEREATRDRILRTSRALLATRGSVGVSNREFAHAAGLALGNFTYHFPTRADLLYAHRAAALALFERELTASDQPGPVGVRYAAFIQGTISVMGDYRFLMDAGEPVSGGTPQDLAHRQFSRLRRFIQEFESAGALCAGPLSAEALALTIWMIVRYWPHHLRDLEGGQKFDERQQDRAYNHHLNVLRAFVSTELIHSIASAKSRSSSLQEERQTP